MKWLILLTVLTMYALTHLIWRSLNCPAAVSETENRLQENKKEKIRMNWMDIRWKRKMNGLNFEMLCTDGLDVHSCTMTRNALDEINKNWSDAKNKKNKRRIAHGLYVYV